jgi:hypothetical protein
MMAYPGMCYAGMVDWLSQMCATDSVRTDNDHTSAVTECLLAMGVPAGWLHMFGGRDVAELVYQTWSDGWLNSERDELEWLTECLGRLQLFTSAGTPWGMAAWHVLVGLVQHRYGDTYKEVWL